MDKPTPPDERVQRMIALDGDRVTAETLRDLLRNLRDAGADDIWLGRRAFALFYTVPNPNLDDETKEYDRDMAEWHARTRADLQERLAAAEARAVELREALRLFG